MIVAAAPGLATSAVWSRSARHVSRSPLLPTPVPTSRLWVVFAALPIPLMLYVGEIAAAAIPVMSKAAAEIPAATADRTALRIVTPLSLPSE